MPLFHHEGTMYVYVHITRVIHVGIKETIRVTGALREMLRLPYNIYYMRKMGVGDLF